MDKFEQPWTVVYSDGSANVMTFRRQPDDAATRVSYEPVTPAQSSSGVYSGGTKKESALDDVATQKLWALLAKIERSTGEHTPQRQKGTGEFTLTVSGLERHFRAQSGRLLAEFEAFVAPYRGDEPVVSIVGVADNAKVGALLATDKGPVWVDRESWPEAAIGKKVKAAGRWSSRQDLPVFPAGTGDAVRAGIPVAPGTDLDEASNRKVLVLISWEVVRVP